MEMPSRVVCTLHARDGHAPDAVAMPSAASTTPLYLPGQTLWFGEPDPASVGNAPRLEQSDAWCRIRIAGPQAADLLSQGTALDVQSLSLQPGFAACTTYADIPVVLSRHGEHAFGMLVARSYADSLLAALTLRASC